jgi:acyl-CoA reductase-like NAD-dependent aldehyde dehydrogenase
LLELGGKAPLLILADADLDEAVKAAAFGAFFNQGQICMSTERIIVHEAVAEDFADKFKAKIATLVAGNPAEGKTPLGSMIDADAVTGIQALIDDAVAKGATLYRAASTDRTLMSAAALDRVTPDMRIYSDESFGPVTAIIRVKDDEEAIRVANDSEYGLSAAIFTRDVAKGLKLAKRVQSGICHINGPTVHDEAQMPFGGVKASGYGRFGGSWGGSRIYRFALGHHRNRTRPLSHLTKHNAGNSICPTNKIPPPTASKTALPGFPSIARTSAIA